MREQADQHQRGRSTRVNQLLFVGMLAVLVGQASAENVLSGITPDSVRVFSKPKLSEREVEWNLQGNYGYFASKFSPRAGVLRSPAIYMINHNNDIFVQVKKGESVGKLINLMVRSESSQPVNTREGVRE